MVKDLDHLLAGDHLLDVAVHVAQGSLLAGVKGGAALCAEPDVGKHRRIAQHHDQRKLPVEHKQQNQRAGHLDKALDGHGKAVVQRVRHRVHVVGKIAHDIAVAPGVKKAQRQLLDVGKQVAADVVQHLLGGADHRLGIAEGRQHAHAVNARRDRHAADQGAHVAIAHTVDHRADHVGAQQVGQRADGDQHRHRQKQELVPPHVGQQRAHGKAEIFGLFTRYRPCHRCRLLSSGNGRSPGRWGRTPAAPGGCPPRGCGRRPAPRSGRCPSPR